MTYNEMQKEIEQVKHQIDFLYEVRDTHYSCNKEDAHTIGNIINSLLAYQNYLRFEKSYTDTLLVEGERKLWDRRIKELEKESSTDKFGSIINDLKNGVQPQIGTDSKLPEGCREV